MHFGQFLMTWFIKQHTECNTCRDYAFSALFFDFPHKLLTKKKPSGPIKSLHCDESLFTGKYKLLQGSLLALSMHVLIGKLQGWIRLLFKFKKSPEIEIELPETHLKFLYALAFYPIVHFDL